MNIDINNLKSDCVNGNFKKWDSNIHKIYGGCAHIGAQALAAICDEGQALGGKNKLEILRIHDLVLMEYNNILIELGHYNKKGQGF